MTQRRREQLADLILAKGGFAAVAARLDISPEMLYSVVKYGTRRPGLDLALRLKAEIGVDPADWPKPKTKRSDKSSAA